MVSLERPWALLFLLLIPVVIILYILRTRYRSIELGSLYIWKELEAESAGARSLKKRRMLLLLLQVLALVAAIAALSGPGLVSERVAMPGTAFIVDTSASMQYAESPGGMKRIEKAKAILLDEIDALPDGSPIAIFSASSRVSMVGEVSGRKRTQKAQAEKIAASIGVSDSAFDEALVATELGVFFAGRDEAWNLVYIGDGGMNLGGQLLYNTGGGFFRELISSAYDKGGSDTDQPLAISHLEIKSGRAEFRIINPQESSLSLSLSLEHEGEEIAFSEMDALPGSSAASIQMDRASAAGRYTLEIKNADDGWDAYRDGMPGSRAYAVINTLPRKRVLIAGEAGPFIRAAFSQPQIQLFALDKIPDDLEAGDWDLLIAVEQKTGKPLPVNFLSFGPVPDNSPIARTYEMEGVPENAIWNSPIARFVNFSDMGQVAAPAFVYDRDIIPDEIALLHGQPILLAWETDDGYKRLAMSLDPFQTAFVAEASWPIFVKNALGWFGIAEDEGSHFAGRDYDGDAGFYPMEYRGSEGFIAVNIPVEELAFRAAGNNLPDSGVSVLGKRLHTSRKDLSPIFFILFIVLLCLEFLLWLGRRAGHE